MVLIQNKDMQAGQQHVIELKLENAKDLHPVFKALMFRENGVINVDEHGLRLIVDDQNCIQAIAYVKSEMFADFILRQKNVIFRIPLAILTECLSVFGTGSNTVLKMVYDGHGEPLKVLLEKDGVVVKCIIKTQNPEIILNFDFDGVNLPAKVIMKPQKLREAFQELDPSSPTVGIRISDHVISISTEGDYGKIKTDFPQHSEQIERFDCSSTVDHKYRLCLIKKMTPCLNLCNKVSLRIDNRGVLSMQFMIEQSDNSNIFVEFFCVPDVDVYDDDDSHLKN